MITLFRKPRNASLLFLLLAILSVVTLATVAALGRSEIIDVSIETSSDGALKRESVSLPFVGKDTDKVSTFTVNARILLSPSSSGVLRIAPDDCIESVTINDKNTVDLTSKGEWIRCWPHMYMLDGSESLQPGENTLSLEIANKAGPYGIGIDSVYSQSALIVMVTAFWLLVYVLVCATVEKPSRRRTIAWERLARTFSTSFLSLFGFLLTVATNANSKGTGSLTNPATISIVAMIIFAAMLLRCLDRLENRPITLRPSVTWTMFSVSCFAYASLLLSQDANTLWITALPMLGVMASIFAMTPVLPFLKRAAMAPQAVAVMIIASLWPDVYWTQNLPAWGYLSGVTSAMVRGILWVCGFPTSTSTGEKKGEDGQITDYYVYVSSSDFSVQIGSWCSGFEGVSLFIFLLSVFVLLDWGLFSKVKHLWAIYLLTVPFVLAINAFRIAGLFAYAVWNVREYGRTQAIWATIEAFHSNIGWVMYSVAFAVFLPLVYRWARRAAKVS